MIVLFIYVLLLVFFLGISQPVALEKTTWLELTNVKIILISDLF